MTEESLVRLMRAQLVKAQDVLQTRLRGEGKRNDLKALEHEISNTLAVVDSESKYVKKG